VADAHAHRALFARRLSSSWHCLQTGGMKRVSTVTWRDCARFTSRVMPHKHFPAMNRWAMPLEATRQSARSMGESIAMLPDGRRSGQCECPFLGDRVAGSELTRRPDPNRPRTSHREADGRMRESLCQVAKTSKREGNIRRPPCNGTWYGALHHQPTMGRHLWVTVGDFSRRGLRRQVPSPQVGQRTC